MTKKYISREAAISALRLVEVRDSAYNFPAGMLSELKRIPAADVVEVVRCRECEFWERDRITCEGVARCRTGESGVRYRSGHDYCSRGILKRKDGGQDE